MIKSKYVRLLLVFFASAVLLSGCSTTKTEYLHKPFEADKVGRIAVLPFLDGRQQPDPGSDFKFVATEASALLIPEIKYRRHYRAFDTTEIGDVSEYSAHVIEPSPGQYAPPDFVKQLGPSQAKWVLVPVCEDLGRYNVVLYAGGSASVSLYLFNKETGELWWKGSSDKRQAMGGLIGGLVDAMDKYQMEIASLAACGHAAMKTLPEFNDSNTKSGYSGFVGRYGANGVYGNMWIARHYSVESASDLQRIAVTSVVDGRRRESKDVVYEPNKMQDEILKILHDKGYDGFAVQGFGQQESVSKDHVALADPTFGKSLVGVGAKYVLIPVTDDVSKSPEFGKHYEFSFYLFNSESGELIWEGSSIGRSVGESLQALEKGDGLPRRKDLMK